MLVSNNVFTFMFLECLMSQFGQSRNRVIMALTLPAYSDMNASFFCKHWNRYLCVF